MTKIGLFYGTQTGYTQTDAETIQKEFGGDSIVELIDVSRAEASDFGRFENIIIGCPTWNIGELQDDSTTLIFLIKMLPILALAIRLAMPTVFRTRSGF
jgi:flavodoxin